MFPSTGTFDFWSTRITCVPGWWEWLRFSDINERWFCRKRRNWGNYRLSGCLQECNVTKRCQIETSSRLDVVTTNWPEIREPDIKGWEDYGDTVSFAQRQSGSEHNHTIKGQWFRWGVFRVTPAFIGPRTRRFRGKCRLIGLQGETEV